MASELPCRDKTGVRQRLPWESSQCRPSFFAALFLPTRNDARGAELYALRLSEDASGSLWGSLRVVLFPNFNHYTMSNSSDNVFKTDYAVMLPVFDTSPYIPQDLNNGHHVYCLSQWSGVPYHALWSE